MASKRTRANKPEMIHCPYCGEDYSSTYKHCPFCDEVEPAEDDYQTDEYDEAPRSRGGKRLVTKTRGGGYGVGDVGSVVLRDRKHLAEDGMIVVVVSMSGEDGSVVSGPDIITRGFVYVKESEGLMEELRKVAVKALEECRMDTMNDWASIKSEIKNAISGFLYKKTKRNPMILPVIMEV